MSYYDKSLFRVYDESYNSFAVVFNDTIRFNRNYQYDVAFTDYFLTQSMNKVMWYKNTFTSAGNVSFLHFQPTLESQPTGRWKYMLMMCLRPHKVEGQVPDTGQSI